MKNTKKIICIALCLFTALTLFSACGKKDEPTGEELLITEETTEEELITIEEPGKETEKHTEKETTTKKSVTTTQRAVTKTKRYENTTSKQSVTTKKMTTPSTTKKPEQTTQRRETTTKKQEVTTTKKTEPTTKKPVTTTKAEPVSKSYFCGSKNHHCTTKEEHAFIKSLEEKGCSICGSHSCRSFYAIDEWGNNCYDITKCPKYSEKKDPANYCEHCGKEIGLGDDGTCVRFTVDTKCPICGKKVPAKTCHTH